MLSCYYFRFSEYACTCKSIIVIPQVVVKKSCTIPALQLSCWSGEEE